MLPICSAKGSQAARHAADLDPIGMAQESQKHACAAERVCHVACGEFPLLHVVGIVADIRPIGAERIVCVIEIIRSPAGMTDALERPHHGAVLIEGEHQFPRRTHFSLHKIAERGFRVDVILNIGRTAEQLRIVAGGRTVIVMHGDKIKRIVALLQHFQIPLWIMIEEGRGGGTHRRFNAAVHPFHRFGHLIGQHAVPSRILFPGTDLPGAVHLIAKIPGFHLIRFLPAVLPAQIGPIGSSRMVCVFRDVDGVLQRARAQVDRVHGLRRNLFRPLQVFVVSHVIWNILKPGQIQVRLALLHGADGILPLPAGHKVAAGQAKSRQPGFPQCVHEIAAEALCVCRGMLGVVHAAVDDGADRLHERAI